MGKSADETRANEFVSGADKTRANAARKKKQRDDAFKTYQDYPGDMLQTDKRVLANIKLATDLENKAKTQDWTGQDRSKHNIGFKGTSYQVNLREAMFPFGKAMSEIQSQSYKSQAEHLRKGGKPVYDQYENYQGVVHKNWLGHTSYSGRLGWNPLGRSDVNYNTESGSYTSSFKDDLQGGSESSNVSTSNIETNNVTDSQSASVKPTVRKSLLASNMSGGGDAKRRGLINARKLT